MKKTNPQIITGLKTNQIGRRRISKIKWNKIIEFSLLNTVIIYYTPIHDVSKDSWVKLCDQTSVNLMENSTTFAFHEIYSVGIMPCIGVKTLAIYYMHMMAYVVS